MKKLETLKTLCRLFLKPEDKTSILIAQGPNGLGKSTTINEVLIEAKVAFRDIGSYTTPLHLYNSMAETPDRLFLLDDSHNIFENRLSLSILKAATFRTAGSDGRRLVSWGSSAKQVKTKSFEFTGKVILLCNQITDSPDSKALEDRAYTCKLELTREERYAFVEHMREVCYANSDAGKLVCDYILKNFDLIRDDAIQYRSFEKWVQLVARQPEGWEFLLDAIVPKRKPSSLDLQQVVLELARDFVVPKEQLSRFKERTGYSEATFFRLRRELGMSSGISNFVPPTTADTRGVAVMTEADPISQILS